MDNQSLQKIKDILNKSNNIGVVVGKDPSVDEMAGALSLYLLLRDAGKSVTVGSPSEPIVELSSLVGINRVQRNLGGEAGDLVVSFPYVEGEIEKVSYTLEEGFLNIIVKASEQGLSFDEKDVRFVRGSGSVDLLFVVGTPRLADLGDIVDQQKLRDVTVINIDNKENNQQFGDVVLVSSKFSSVSEQVADLVLALGFQLNQDVAQNLLSGITVATSNFQDPRTTSLAFEVAALLLKRGARRLVPAQGGREVREERAERPSQQPNQGGKSWLDDVASRQDRDESQRRPQEDNQGDRRQASSGRRSSNEEQARQDARPSNDRQDRQREEQNRQRFQQQQQQQQQRQQKDEKVESEEKDTDEEPPLDWLTPKVYKGSSDVE